MKKALIILGVMLVPAIACAEGLDKYIELLRSDLRTTKTELLTESLALTGDQGTKFWPIDREYETELAKIADARIAMIKDYAQSYTAMTPEKAKSIITQAFKLQEQRTALLKKYTSRVSKEVSPMVAARFAQTESFVHSLIDVQVRGEVPLVP